MRSAKLQKWVAVNKNMNPGYRERVVKVALTYLPHASEELKQRAEYELTKNVQIPRHKFLDAPFNMQYRFCVEQFENKSIIAAIIINLWAESQFNLILHLRNAAMQKGFRLAYVSQWEWNLEGFVHFDELGKFNEFCDNYVQGKSKEEHDDILLAELWLGKAYIESLEAAELKLQEAQQTSKDSKIKATSKLKVIEDKPKTTEIIQPTSTNLNLPVEGITEIIETPLEEEDDEPQDINLIELEGLINSEVSAYNEVKKRMGRVFYQAKTSLILEKSLRGGVNLDLGFFDIETENIETKINFIRDAIRQIRSYDKEKSGLITKIEKAVSELAQISDEIKQWSPNTSQEQSITSIEELRDFSIQQLKTIFSETQKTIEARRQEKNKLRQARVNTVKNLAQRLQDAQYQLEEPIEGLKDLSGFFTNEFTEWEVGKINRAEEKLEQYWHEISNRSSKDVEVLIEEYISTGSRKSFTKLLEKLSKDKRDIECFFLALARNANGKQGELGFDVNQRAFNSVINGLQQFSKKTSSFQTLNYSAPYLFSSWTTTEPRVQMEICILLLTAKYTSTFQLPPETLWEIADWPDKRMKNWSSLWEKILMDQPVQFVFHTREKAMGALIEARSQAAQSLAKDYGSFVRLASIKSRRHASMLRIQILPKLFDDFEAISKIDRFLSGNAGIYEKKKNLDQLEITLINRMQREYSADAINNIYDHAILAEDINDSDAFHRKTSIKLITEISESVLLYAVNLFAYWSEWLNEDDRIHYSDLEKELEMIDGLHEFTIQSFKTWTETVPQQATFERFTSQKLLADMITAEFLTQSLFPLKYTRVVGELVNNDFNWDGFSSALLEDIKLPFTAETAAHYLLEKLAPTHVLMIGQHLSLEIQKSAQELKRQKEREIVGIENELMKIGGNYSDIASEKDLGRWPFVLGSLEKKLSELKLENQKTRISKQTLARQIRTQINELDNNLFEVKEIIPVDAFEVLVKCMDYARNATEKSENIPFVQEFIKELRYRLDHQSWPTEDLRTLEEKFQVLSKNGEDSLQVNNIGINELLGIFETGNIKKLGLTSEDIALSSINTRVEILRSWVQIKSGRGFQLEQQASGLRLAIQNFVRYFTQMLSMKKSVDPQGRHITHESPFIYSYWDLMYPKTSSLDESCVLVMMPGNPPSQDDINFFLNKMEQDEWLDYWFVFLFIPGGTKKLC